MKKIEKNVEKLVNKMMLVVIVISLGAILLSFLATSNNPEYLIPVVLIVAGLFGNKISKNENIILTWLTRIGFILLAFPIITNGWYFISSLWGWLETHNLHIVLIIGLCVLACFQARKHR